MTPTRPPAGAAELPRVVSLVPSHTETLWELGANLVGLTRFCIEPPGLRERFAVVGGTKDPDVDAIVALAPDVVIANHEENTRDAVLALSAAGLRVLETRPATVRGGIACIRTIGDACGVGAAARRLADCLDAELDALGPPPEPARACVAYVWRAPWMIVGAGTYGDDVLRLAGWRNVAHDLGAAGVRYPELPPAQAAACGARVALLPDEPFHFSARHAAEVAAAGPAARLVDGQDLFWYGPRSVAAVVRLRAVGGDIASRAAVPFE